MCDDGVNDDGSVRRWCRVCPGVGVRVRVCVYVRDG